MMLHSTVGLVSRAYPQFHALTIVLPAQPVPGRPHLVQFAAPESSSGNYPNATAVAFAARCWCCLGARAEKRAAKQCASWRELEGAGGALERGGTGGKTWAALGSECLGHVT